MRSGRTGDIDWDHDVYMRGRGQAGQVTHQMTKRRYYMSRVSGQRASSLAQRGARRCSPSSTPTYESAELSTHSPSLSHTHTRSTFTSLLCLPPCTSASSSRSSPLCSSPGRVLRMHRTSQEGALCGGLRRKAFGSGLRQSLRIDEVAMGSGRTLLMFGKAWMGRASCASDDQMLGTGQQTTGGCWHGGGRSDFIASSAPKCRDTYRERITGRRQLP
ncbi:hypothetical protein V8E36_009877 [Tilletia maclaganii]